MGTWQPGTNQRFVLPSMVVPGSVGAHLAVHMRKRTLVFIDAFAGCGGLSLGLLQAGLEGRLAIEKDSFAFATLKANLLDRDGLSFCWPDWFPKKPMSIEV